jgi:hypothetical protein
MVVRFAADRRRDPDLARERDADFVLELDFLAAMTNLLAGDSSSVSTICADTREDIEPMGRGDARSPRCRLRTS